MENSRGNAISFNRNPISFNNFISHLLKILPRLFITSRGGEGRLHRRHREQCEGRSGSVTVWAVQGAVIFSQTGPAGGGGMYVLETELGEGGQGLQRQEPHRALEGFMQSRVRFGFGKIPCTRGRSPGEEMQGPRQLRSELEEDGAREGRQGRWEGRSGG